MWYGNRLELRIISFSVILASSFILSCTDMGSEPENEPIPEQVSYADDIQPIFNSNCAGSQCHIGGMSNGLSLVSYSTLMEGGISGPVVIPGEPDSSIIVRRLEGTIQPQMPFQLPPLPHARIQLIRDWIAQGAHDN
jgi:hypothetical protein